MVKGSAVRREPFLTHLRLVDGRLKLLWWEGRPDFHRHLFPGFRCLEADYFRQTYPDVSFQGSQKGDYSVACGRVIN